MKRYFLYGVMVIIFSLTIIAQQSKPNQPKLKTKSSNLKTNEDKMSYLSGYDLGLKVKANVKSNKFPLQSSAFITGIKAALDGTENQLSPEEIQQVIEIFQKMNPQTENQKKLQEITAKYQKEGEDFLAANGKKDSVKTTASGLQYKILREGAGASPAETSTVTVHYRGRLISGLVFDESYSKGAPISFMLKRVIKGWVEGLQLMTIGSKFEFYIPHTLAYGDQPSNQLIPPGSMLIFEVELISIQ